MRYRIVLVMMLCVVSLSACGTEVGESNQSAVQEVMSSEEETASVEGMPEGTRLEAAASGESMPEEIRLEAEALEETASEEAISENEAQELTMNGLIELCESGGLERLIREQGLDGFRRYENLKEEQFEHSLTWMYTGTLAWEDREYILQIYFWMPGISPERGHKEYEIDAVHLVESETGDRLLLYFEDSRYTANADIRSFLEKQYGMDQYMTFELPKGYELGGYQADMAGFSGSLLVGEYEEPAHGDGTPESWYAPGGMAVFQRDMYLNFENGELVNVTWMANHSWVNTEPEKLEGCETQALLCEVAFDLFTAAEWGEYWEENGEELSEEEATSKYWYVFMGDEERENGYAIFLNEKYFIKEDAIAFAESIHLLETE